MSIRVRVVVSGRVQGVFFRVACATEARRRGLAGSVRNLPDGRVEAIVEGPPSDVEELVAWCRTGPDHARVDAIEIETLDPIGETGFRVTG